MNKITFELINDSKLTIQLTDNEVIGMLMSLKSRLRFNAEPRDLVTQFIRNNFEIEMNLIINKE